MQKTPHKKLFNIGEFGLIKDIESWVTSLSSGAIGIGDDTAVIPMDSNKSMLLTTDMLVEGVHFVKATPWDLVGRKALACSISDIAAMAGCPQYALISLGLPKEFVYDDIKLFYQGLNNIADEFGVQIVGGDTVSSDKFIVNVSLIGSINTKDIVKRSGAYIGDRIFVTGPLGGSFDSGRHLTFTPRVKEVLELIKYCKPTSMIDISDGLSSDLMHILNASCVGACLVKENIPINSDACLDKALCDGEDFELLFTVPKQDANKLSGKDFYEIGEIVEAEQGLTIVGKDGKRYNFESDGFRHF